MISRSTILILVLVGLSTQLHEYKDFIREPFKLNPDEGIYEINVGLDNQVGQKLIGLGDFNGDKYQDLVVFIASRKQLAIKYWEIDNHVYKFQSDSIINIDKYSSFVTQQIGDFDYNGLLDIMLITKDSNKYNLIFILQHSRGKFVIFESKQQSLNIPTQVDLYGDKTTQLLFNDLQSNRVVYKLTKNGKEQIRSFTDFLDPKCNEKVQNKKLISSPNWNHYIDINGDCNIDLFITSQLGDQIFLETYIRQSKDKFCLVSNRNEKDIKSILSIKLTDINMDGGLDMLILKDIGSQKTQLVTYLGQNHIDILNLCPKANELKQYPFKNDKVQTQEFNFQVKHSEYEPCIILLGDTNQDGYQDIIINVAESKDKTVPVYLQNEFRKSSMMKYDPESRLNKRFKQINKFENIAFFDIGEDGQLDIMYTADQKINALLMNYYFDTYFIKANIGNGMNTENQGNYAIGATLQCIIVTITNQKKVLIHNQATQSAYNSLQLPYMLFGLGRTNNYVENMNVGLGYEQKKKWSPIIPNTQLLIFPYTEQKSKWNIAIYLKPTRQIQVIILIISILLAVLGFVILYLHIQEKKEDKKNQIDITNIFI